jgi:FMN phosphatase YigB (HAD superfamily)
MAGNIVLAFDLYGTLLSTESITQQLAPHFPEKAPTISSLWRRYQLEYTWRLTSMGMQRRLFKLVTKNNSVMSQAFTKPFPRSRATPSATPWPNTTKRSTTTQ